MALRRLRSCGWVILRRDAAAAGGVRHQHGVAAGERQVGRERRALVAALLLDDLHQDHLAALDDLLDLVAARAAARARRQLLEGVLAGADLLDALYFDRGARWPRPRERAPSLRVGRFRRGPCGARRRCPARRRRAVLVGGEASVERRRARTRPETRSSSGTWLRRVVRCVGLARSLRPVVIVAVVGRRSPRASRARRRPRPPPRGPAMWRAGARAPRHGHRRQPPPRLPRRPPPR